MGVLFTDTVTVYNHSIDKNGLDTWVRHVVNGVQWTHRRIDFSIGGNVAAESFIESLTFDFDRDYLNAPYVEPVAYARLDDEQKAAYWTLQTDGQDIVVLGATTMEIAGGASIDELKAQFQFVCVPTSVTDNRNRPRLRTVKAVVK